MKKARHEFTWVEGAAFLFACIGVQMASELMNQWGLYFYSPSEGVGRTIYLSAALAGAIFLVATMWDAVSDPLVGYFSDRTSTKPGRFRLLRIKGRRRPYIFWGALLMTFTAIAFWYPPVPEESFANFIYGAVILCMHWTLFTVCVVPFNALGPEIARSKQARVRLGVWIGVGMAVGLAIANALPGVLIASLDPARQAPAPEALVEEAAVHAALPDPLVEQLAGARAEDGEALLDAPQFSPEGYRRVATLFAVLTFLFFMLPVVLVRERYDSAADTEPHRNPLAEIILAFKNRAFVCFFFAFFFFSAGFLAVQRAIPYWAELGLEGDESTVTILLAPFILTALLSYAVIPLVARKLRLKWIMLAAFCIITLGLPMMYPLALADLGIQTKTYLGAILFATTGIGQGIMYVLMMPMLGEIIDYDERHLTGRRREAVYNGIFGFAWKASMGISVLTASLSMEAWGKSVDNPLGVYLVGPLGGLLALLGMAALLLYPKLQVMPDREDEVLKA